MLFRRKDPRDEIPTLHNLVEDESVTAQTDAVRASAPKDTPALSAEHPVMSAANAAAPRAQSRSAFEATIETLVGEILNRHMQNAREEITRAVLTEVRARLRRDERAKTDKD